MIKEKIKSRGRKLTRYGSKLALSRPYNPHYANDSTVLRPEVWAQESVRLLFEEMIWGGIVHRDFEDEIKNFGETVHTRYPQEFKAKRKQNDMDNLVDQDAVATGIDVKLNQRVYVSFLLGDGERSKSFKNLFDFYMVPQMQAQARLIDRVVSGQVYQYLGNMAGALEGMSGTTASDYMLDARQKMNDNKVNEQDRWLGLASRTETAMQKTDLFKSAERVGDGGRALRDASIGRKHAFNTFLSLNTPSVRSATKTTATTTTAAALAGATAVDVTSATNLVIGEYFTIAGDMTPLRSTVVSTLNITVSRPLLRSVAAGAVIQPYALGAVNQVSAVAAGDTTLAATDGYPAGWMGAMNVDGTGVPQVGQLVAFKTAGGAIHTAEYCIIDVTVVSATYDIMLDRPLEVAVANNDIVCYGPNGDYNFGLQRSALALVNRPLDLPPEGAGARAARGFFNNMSMRTVITYDGLKQATRVTIDALLGVKPLQTQRGVVLLG